MSAGILLLVVLTIVPRTYLHDAFAEHIEISVCTDSHENGPCIHQDGFNCALYELIVPHEYEPIQDQHSVSYFQFAFRYSAKLTSSKVQFRHSARLDRGPPTMV